MRKLLCILTLLLLIAQVSIADELYLDKDTKYQKQIMSIGFKILNANNFEKRTTFFYSTENKVKVKDVISNKTIVVYKGIIPIIENEDEMAALLSREIAYMNDMRHGIFRRTAIGYNPRKYEIKADKRGVDYMVKAGYNPVGMILLLNKTTREPNWFDYPYIYHQGSERAAAVYEHIYQKYPEFLIHNEYLSNPVYQNFLHTSKKERKEIRLIQEEKIKIHQSKKEKKK